jgi:hypothetical protein
MLKMRQFQKKRLGIPSELIVQTPPYFLESQRWHFKDIFDTYITLMHVKASKYGFSIFY